MHSPLIIGIFNQFGCLLIISNDLLCNLYGSFGIALRLTNWASSFRPLILVHEQSPLVPSIEEIPIPCGTNLKQLLDGIVSIIDAFQRNYRAAVRGSKFLVVLISKLLCKERCFLRVCNAKHLIISSHLFIYFHCFIYSCKCLTYHTVIFAIEYLSRFFIITLRQMIDCGIIVFAEPSHLESIGPL